MAPSEYGEAVGEARKLVEQWRRGDRVSVDIEGRRVRASDFETKDSGDRVEYDSGMVRDTNGGKPRFDLMIPKGIPFEDLYLTRVARLYERGAQKYTPRNWEKADSDEELDRAKESAFRHFMQWYAGETDEDHGAAVFFNINEVETIKSKQRDRRDAGYEVATFRPGADEVEYHHVPAASKLTMDTRKS